MILRTPYFRRALCASATASLLALLACAPPPPPPPAPTIDAEQVALRLEAATRLEEPSRILFEWSLSETDLRLRGRGVARIEPPYKARLDLFLANGETVVRAALVDDDLRLPPGAPEGIIPPPDLLWGTLGVFRPGASTRLLGAEDLGGGRIGLRYRHPDGLDVRYTLVDGRIEGVERLREGRVVESLSLVRDGVGERLPSEATYRNVPAFRELRIARQSVEHVEPYPDDIWRVRR